MDPLPSQVSDEARLRAVAATGLLDSGPEEEFDRLTRLAARLVGAPFAFVTVVDERRSWWKSCVGTEALGIDEIPVTVGEDYVRALLAFFKRRTVAAA